MVFATDPALMLRTVIFFAGTNIAYNSCVDTGCIYESLFGRDFVQFVVVSWSIVNIVLDMGYPWVLPIHSDR